MTLLDLELADRFATAAAQAGAPEAAGIRAMNLTLLGRSEEAETALRELAEQMTGLTATAGRRCGQRT